MHAKTSKLLVKHNKARKHIYMRPKFRQKACKMKEEALKKKVWHKAYNIYIIYNILAKAYNIQHLAWLGGDDVIKKFDGGTLSLLSSFSSLSSPPFS